MIDTEKLLFVCFCALTPKAYFNPGTDSWAAPEAEESILGYDGSLQICPPPHTDKTSVALLHDSGLSCDPLQKIICHP